MKVPAYGIETPQSQQGQMPSRAQMLMAAAMLQKNQGPEYGGIDFQPEFEAAKSVAKSTDKALTSGNTRYKDEPTAQEKFKRKQSEKPDLEELRQMMIEDPKGSQNEGAFDDLLKETKRRFIGEDI